MKNLKNKKIILLITSFNQLHGYHAIESTYHITLQATPCQLMCWQRYDSQYCLQIKLVSNTKKKTGN
jgi:hypothetical protein